MSVSAVDVKGDEVDSIKTQVANILARADRDVDVKKTTYFNHTYAPDLVLTWPRDRKLIRRVFLRTTSDPRYIREDIDLSDDQSSIFMPLNALYNDDDGNRELQESARSARVLVAEEAGIADLAERRVEKTVVELASRAILQGGSGLVAHDRASNFALTVVEGFEAAQEGKAPQTKTAITQASALLDGRRAGRIESFLHAVWVGSGAANRAFPGPSGLGVRLDSRSLALLLNTIDLEDSRFWKRIAKTVSLPLLASLKVEPDLQNFQRLANAALPMMRARGIRVVKSRGREEELSAGIRWFPSKGDLGFNLGNLTALVSDQNISNLSEPGLRATVSLRQLQQRARRGNLQVVELSAESGTRHLDYTASDGENVVDDKGFESLDASLGGSSILTTATLVIDDIELPVNFDSSTARTRGRTKLSLPTLVGAVVPLLGDLSLSMHDAIRDLAEGGIDEDERVAPELADEADEDGDA